MSMPHGDLPPPAELDDVEVDTSVNGLSTEFARLRERRTRITTNKKIKLPIPGYNGELVAEYRLLEWKEIRKIIGRMQTKGSRSGGDTLDMRELNAQVDTLVAACETLLYMNDQGDYISLNCKYDIKFAENMGFQANTAREVVLQTFRNEIAISAHHGDLVEWMQGLSAEADEEFLGESPARLP